MNDHELNDDEKRALKAYTDVLAVEWDEQAGVARVLTLSDCYMAVPSEGMHLCPDREYHDVDLCKHVRALETVRGKIDAPEGWLVVEDFDERTEPEFPVSTEFPDFEEYRVLADGAGEQMPEGLDQWTVWDPERENAHHFDNRGEAEDRQEKAAADFDIDADIYPPGQLPDQYDAPDTAPEPDESDPNPTTDGGETVPADGAEPVDAEIVDHSPDAGEDHEPEYALDDRQVGEDPLEWVPGEFIDHIDGSPAINRKGFEVLSHFYDIDVESEVVVPPEDTEHEFCRVESVATTPDGRHVEAHGSAHIDRGDDHYLLLEMADTRARKRALSIATGVGAVAVEELKNEVGQ